jgi:histidinol phosphatase-like enzyme (inositol monophosphatase family)
MPRTHLLSAIEFAKQAGAFTLDYFYDPGLVVERKRDATPVTAADRGAERILRERISERFPQDSIVGEEFPVREGTSEYRWILDPIDGTKSFIHGVPTYSTLIGIEKNGEPVIGVIALPALREVLWASKGEGAWHETPRSEKPVRARVSACPALDCGLFLVSEVLTFTKTGRLDAYLELQNTAGLTSSWGDAYGYFLVATGRAEVMIDPDLNLWDAAPLLPIITEAGGHFTDWQGNPTIHNEEAVATNGILHEEVMTITRRYSKQPAA